jgi:hypothetical protein
MFRVLIAVAVVCSAIIALTLLVRAIF